MTSPLSRKQRALSAHFSLEKCQACHKNVYIMERIEAAGHVFHKQCLKCETCRHVLNAANFSYFEGKYYCIPHAKRAKTGFDERYLRRQLTFKKLKLEGNKEEEEETEKGEEAEKDKEKENLANEVAQLKSEKNQWKAEKERMEVELAELRRAKEKEVEEQKNEKEKLESELATLRLELEKEKEEADKAREAIAQIRMTWGKLHSKYELLEEYANTLAKLKQERVAGQS